MTWYLGSIISTSAKKASRAICQAASAYVNAKIIIKLINNVGKVINNDPDTGKLLKVAFATWNEKTAGYRFLFDMLFEVGPSTFDRSKVNQHDIT